MTEIIPVSAEPVETPTSPNLPVLADTLGIDEMYRRVDKALAYPGAIVTLGKGPDAKDYVPFIGNALIASLLGVSVTTGEVTSRLAADGELEYSVTARVLGPFGSIVSAEAIYSLADLKARKGPKLDRGQVVNLLGTRAFNRVMKMAYAPFIYAARPDGSAAPAHNTLDDAPPDDMGGTREIDRLYGEELAAAADVYTEQAVANRGDRDAMRRIHAEAKAVGLSWDKEISRYVDPDNPPVADDPWEA